VMQSENYLRPSGIRVQAFRHWHGIECSTSTATSWKMFVTDYGRRFYCGMVLSCNGVLFSFFLPTQTAWRCWLHCYCTFYDFHVTLCNTAL
jgi:hypothetical protein